MSQPSSGVQTLIEIPGSPEPNRTVLVIPDTPEVIFVPDSPRRPPAACKDELRAVLNAFQASPGYGLYVCEAFRDPRFEYIDQYWPEVAGRASGIAELGSLVGRRSAPLSPEARAAFLRFRDTLASLAGRIDRALAGV